jgi:hypothetical protein
LSPATVSAVVEPTHNGVAAEGQYAAALRIYFCDERVVDPVELDGKLFCSSLGTEGIHQSFRQRGEP